MAGTLVSPYFDKFPSPPFQEATEFSDMVRAKAKGELVDESFF